MKKSGKKILKVLSVSVGLGVIHFILHKFVGLPYVNVTYWLAIIYFLWRFFLEEKIFKDY